MAELDQETYLTTTLMRSVIWRGCKKFIVESSSIKTLFLLFICLAIWFDKISDMWGIIGGLAVLGVKELPSDLFSILIEKFVKKE